MIAEIVSKCFSVSSTHADVLLQSVLCSVLWRFVFAVESGGSCRGTGSVWLCNSIHSLLIQFLLCYIIIDVILQTRNIHWKHFSFVT